MLANEAAPAALDAFLARWEASGSAERANYQLFLSVGVQGPMLGFTAWAV